MFLTILDLILILIIFCFVAFGFTLGLVQSVGALVGIIIGAFLAGKFYQPLAEWLNPVFLGNMGTASIVSFIILFTIVNRAIGIIFYIVNKIFNVLSIIPLLKSFNRLFGSLFGLIEGVLFLGVILYFISHSPFSPWLSEVISASKVAYWLMFIAQLITPLLPDLMKIEYLQKIIKLYGFSKTI